MTVGQADRYIPVAIKYNSLALTDAVYCQLRAVGAGSIPGLYTYFCVGRNCSATHFSPRISIYLSESVDIFIMIKIFILTLCLLSPPLWSIIL